MMTSRDINAIINMEGTNIVSRSNWKNMNVLICTLLALLSQLRLTETAHVSGTITESTTFFCRKLPVTPSLRAVIEFNVLYLKSSMKGGFPLMGIYTEYPAINVEKKCSHIEYGQLRNENLHPYLRVGSYRTTTCVLSGSDTVICRGRVTVQDYIPRNFYLSFGSPCSWQHFSALQGLSYNVSFTKQSNDTGHCINYSKLLHGTACKRSHFETSLPNLIGDEHLNQIEGYFKVVEVYQIALLVEGRCYQHIEEIVCYMVFPKCDPLTNQVVHPCREMCLDLKAACLQTGISIATKTQSRYMKRMLSGDFSNNINCDYLPSLHGSVPCFYKNVMCDSPPDVTNGTVILNSTQKATYQLHDVVQYACVNETFEMRGINPTTCLYSGEWSHPSPICSNQLHTNSLHPLYITLPLLVMSFIIYITLCFCVWYCKKNIQNLTRKKQYDAFVCYCYEGQVVDFAEKIIPLQLEDRYGLKLCIHRRDFKAGWDIKWNIMKAIRNSNSAIIIMSQDYINSLWCVEEFEDCYMENMKDPAFKLLVILMQPAHRLNITNEYIKSFFVKKTYLERNDPKLFKKIAEYLNWVKQVKRQKPPLEGVTEDNIDALLGESGNQNEDENCDPIVAEEQKCKQIEVDGYSGYTDEESATSVSHTDDETGDTFLALKDLENILDKKKNNANLKIRVDVHNVDLS